ASCRVHGQAGPAVAAAGRLPGAGGPRLVAKLAGGRNRVKRPADGTGADVIRPQVAGRRPFLLADPHALDQDILVDSAGTRCDEIRLADRTPQTRGEIYGA